MTNNIQVHQSHFMTWRNIWNDSKKKKNKRIDFLKSEKANGSSKKKFEIALVHMQSWTRRIMT